MKISVLTPTYHLFMKDRQIEALAKQTFRDFEWVIVDDCYDSNKEINASFPIIHIPPDTPVPYFALASALNDGLVRASGKYIFFMNDYVTPEPDCLARHWEVQERLGGCLLSGRSEAMEDLSPVCLDEHGNIITRDYRMGLFERGIHKWQPAEDGLYEVSRAGIQNWWAGRNDSAPLEAILDCNGFDEVFDGRWGGQDADMANRLMTYGLKYFLDTKSLCLEYAHARGDKKQVRSEARQQSFQETVINRKVRDKVFTANVDWLVMLPRNLKEERELWKQ